jgi:uncharacterized membrane protein YedE/YeeE
MKLATSALFGALFGLGLLISGMLDPAKVLGFLDLAGDWNPQLAFVMGGAIAVALPAFQLAQKRQQTLAREPLQLPRRTGLDGRLIGGAAIFGLGWGLSGLCPGPALVAVGFAGPPAFVFAGAMALGTLIARWTLKASASED